MDEDPAFYTACTSLTLRNCIDLSNLKYKKVTDLDANVTIDIDILECNLTSVSVFPDNVTIGALKIYKSLISDVDRLCNSIIRTNEVTGEKSVICTRLWFSSQSLASTDIAGFTYIKPLLELKQAGLSAIKFGGDYVDDAALDYLRNGAIINGVEYVGYGTTNVTRYT